MKKEQTEKKKKKKNENEKRREKKNDYYLAKLKEWKLAAHTLNSNNEKRAKE